MEPREFVYEGLDSATAPDSPGAWGRTRVTRETMATQIERRVAEAVLAGEVLPGDRLVEADLAAEMQTSRGPVREALRQLSETGLVNYVPRRGWFVTRLADKDRTEIAVMRGGLEGLAARLAAARYRAGELDFSALRHALDRMEAAIEANDAKSFFERDWDFHEQLCLASGNAWLHKSWLLMRHGVTLLVANSQFNYSKPEAQLESHREIIDVLMTRSPAECEHYLRRRVIESGYASMHRDPPTDLWTDPL